MHGVCILTLLFLRQHYLTIIQYIIGQYITTYRHFIKNKIVIQVIVLLICINKHQVKRFIQEQE